MEAQHQNCSHLVYMEYFQLIPSKDKRHILIYKPQDHTTYYSVKVRKSKYVWFKRAGDQWDDDLWDQWDEKKSRLPKVPTVTSIYTILEATEIKMFSLSFLYALSVWQLMHTEYYVAHLQIISVCLYSLWLMNHNDLSVI